MKRSLIAVLLAQTICFAQIPPSPFIDKGACPFECCTYRRWKALKRLELLDHPHGESIGIELKPGQWVQAVTGEVRSKPLRTTSTLEAPAHGVHKGDRIYVLHYVGEGSWMIWVRGKVFDLETDFREPEKLLAEWWVKVRTSGGVIGWVRAEGNFENQDMCA